MLPSCKAARTVVWSFSLADKVGLFIQLAVRPCYSRVKPINNRLGFGELPRWLLVAALCFYYLFGTLLVS